MAVDFGAELQRLARGVGSVGTGVQHRTAITQPGHAFAIEQVGVDARHLRRAVGPQPEHAPGQLIDQFERLQIERLAGTGQQGLQMLEQRRHDQLVTVATGRVEQVSPELFDMARLGRQDIGNMIRQDPGGHE